MNKIDNGADNVWRKMWRYIGPGFITGAADDDPSGIVTYAQTGARFGYSQLWLALFTTPFMIAVQEMCGRIGLVRGRGLAIIIRERFGLRVALAAAALLLVANAVNIGADLGAMASTLQMLFGQPFLLWLIAVTVIILLLVVFVPYRIYANLLKYLTLSLLAYVAVAFVVRQDWGAIAWSTFVPHVTWSVDYLFNVVAIFGTTISPYLFFWQASEEVEEEVMEHRLPDMNVGEPEFGPDDLRRMRLDTAIGMIFSNAVMFFIIVTAASTLGAHGYREIGTAAEAAEALRPLAGDFSYVLFALGIIGTGFLAIPVLAGSASYALAETFGWRTGLYRRLKDARGFYGIIVVATLCGLLVNLTPIQPFQMLYYAAAINGILAPPLLLLIVRLSGDPAVLGRYRSGLASRIAGWVIAVVMSLCSLGLLLQLLFG